MSLAHLANELLDAIFTSVHATADLKACSLAARFLVDPSQRHLFRSLSLFSNRIRPGARRKVENTHDPATLSPRLSNYVTELTVYLDSAARQFATLKSVLRKLRSLTRLALVAVGRFRWHEIPSETQSFLQDICGRLHSLSLNRITDVPASFIHHAASSLQALSLTDITVPVYTPVIPRGASSTALKDLVILAKGDNLESALDAGTEKHLRGLRKLELYLSGAYETRREQFFRTSNFYTTLEHIELFLTYPLPSLLLPTLPVLRFMKLQFEFHGTHLPEELDDFLISLPITAPLLESLFLKVDPRSNSGTNWPETARVHPLFISASKLMQALPHLQEIHCSRNKLVLPKYGFAAYMALKLAGAAEAGMLTFSTFRAVRNDT
ncbi:hypothetical protein FB451DRAFT_419173 [Mycena latifolia]|nr:hypothetical protein FB451DRAFT_419173 [Mycena latifolia]